MFSVIGDTVLDPFLGTGITVKVSNELARNSIGYEVDLALLSVIKKKVGIAQSTLVEDSNSTLEILIMDDKEITSVAAVRAQPLSQVTR